MGHRCEISHKVADVTAKPDATYSLTDKLAASSYTQIKDDQYIVDSVPTFEHNRWILDGTMPLANDSTEWGLWSDSISDTDGNFATNPALTATFGSFHTSSGVTLSFCGDSRPQNVKITWYNGTTQLAQQTFTIDAQTYFAELTVESFNKITMEFSSMTVPLRRLKIAEIDFGEIVVWSGDEKLLSASLLEEVNLTSSEVTVNTLSWRVYDTNSDFNMLNPSGSYTALQKKQRITPTEYTNGNAQQMGLFFLDTWENESSNVMKFTAVDVIGLFDSITFRESAMYNGTAASIILAAIFNAAGWTDYTIDSNIGSELMYGYIPIVTVREALHQVCFALRAACIVNRDGSISVTCLPSSDATNPIEKTQKFGTQSIKQNSLVNSVSVTAYKFSLAASSSQLYSATLAVGTYTITFSSPAASLSISGGTIAASGANYATITVLTAGMVTITGYVYNQQTSSYVYENVDGTRSQVTISGVYLVSAANAAALAESIYNDYQRRVVQSFSLYLDDEKIGDNVDVDTMLGARKTGVITKLDVNLTGGFTAAAEVRG